MGSGLAASRKWSRARGLFRAQREAAPGWRGEQPGRHPKVSTTFTVRAKRDGGFSQLAPQSEIIL